MPDLESHWLAERLAYLGQSLMEDAAWRQKASRTFPRLQSAEGRRRLFVHECRTALRNLFGASDLSRPRKELYRELVLPQTLLESGAAGQRRRSAPTGIRCQD